VIEASRLSIIKAYDIRGTVPEQLDTDFARVLGAAFVRVVGATKVVIGRDMRETGPALVAAFAEGATAQGADVIDMGLASTDALYFASGHLGIPGAMVTASHNPAEYNGFKLCRAEAVPVGQDTGLGDIRDLMVAGVPDFSGATGSVESMNLIPEYAKFLRQLVDISAIRPLRVVVDAGNGMAGYTVPAVLLSEAGLPALPLSLDEMYFELDGSFPNHEANPIDPENLRDLQAEVVRMGADIGLAFDGDADRCFVVDERGELVSPSAMTALIAERELRRVPGSSVIHNLITSRAVPEVIVAAGGTPIRTRVGHSFIKDAMARSGAIFGGEHSGHFYFRDFWRADSGMLAAMHVLAELGNAAAEVTVSDLMAPYSPYAASGEINSVVHDHAAVMGTVRSAFSGRPGVQLDELDGLTVSGTDWWFNLRPSNTEPLLRLNVEAPTVGEMDTLRDSVLAMVRVGGAA
jgi:phosphomannomutase